MEEWPEGLEGSRGWFGVSGSVSVVKDPVDLVATLLIDRMEGVEAEDAEVAHRPAFGQSNVGAIQQPLSPIGTGIVPVPDCQISGSSLR